MITPIPKEKQVQLESDARPVAVTLVLSKVLEDFIVSWMIEDIAPSQRSNNVRLMSVFSNLVIYIDIQ